MVKNHNVFVAIFPQLHVVYAQWTDVWSLNYWCGYWSIMYLLNCCVVIELTKTKTVLNPYTGLFWYVATMSFP